MLVDHDVLESCSLAIAMKCQRLALLYSISQSSRQSEAALLCRLALACRRCTAGTLPVGGELSSRGTRLGMRSAGHSNTVGRGSFLFAGKDAQGLASDDKGKPGNEKH